MRTIKKEYAEQNRQHLLEEEKSVFNVSYSNPVHTNKGGWCNPVFVLKGFYKR